MRCLAESRVRGRPEPGTGGLFSAPGLPGLDGLTIPSSATGLSSVSWRGGSLSLTRLCACPDWNSFPCGTTGPRGKGVLADGPPHIVWEKRWADLALEQAEAAGGGGFSFAGSAGCALCEPDGDALFVRELLCPASQTDACMSALLSRFGRTGIVCRTPVRAAEGEGNRCSAFGVLWTMTDGNSSGPLRGINRIWGWR